MDDGRARPTQHRRRSRMVQEFSRPDKPMLDGAPFIHPPAELALDPGLAAPDSGPPRRATPSQGLAAGWLRKDGLSNCQDQNGGGWTGASWMCLFKSGTVAEKKALLHFRLMGFPRSPRWGVCEPWSCLLRPPSSCRTGPAFALVNARMRTS